MDDHDRLEFAQFVLERNLQWIAAAETKVAFILALQTGMIGVLAAAFAAVPATQRDASANAFTFVAAMSFLLAVCACAAAVWPRTGGPPTSLIFFGKVATCKRDDYVSAFKASPVHALLDDCIAQAHRNAEIACEKFAWVRRATQLSFVTLPTWTLALVALLRLRSA